MKDEKQMLHAATEYIAGDSVPPLPDNTRLDPALGADSGKWIDLYVDWAEATSPMTPRIFHESAALVLGSIAIARRLVLPMAHGMVYPNLYVVWIAYSTLFRKTTALNVARNLARQTMPHLLAPQEATPEALLSDMSGREPVNLAQLSEADQAMWRRERNYAAQRGLILDEISGLLANTKKDYNAGLLETLMRFYDCEPEFTRSTTGKGRLTISNAYLTLLGASTPTALGPYLAQEQLWANGWWVRYAILTPDVQRPPWRVAHEIVPPPELKNTLSGLFNKLPGAQYPVAPPARNVVLGKSVFESWSVYNKALGYDFQTEALDHRLRATYGRLPTQLLKVATILAALDWVSTSTPVPVIELSHLARAQSIVEGWRVSAHRALAQARVSKFDELKNRILVVISRHESDAATLRDLGRNITGASQTEIQAALQELLDYGELETAPEGKSRGRKTTKYRIARE